MLIEGGYGSFTVNNKGKPVGDVPDEYHDIERCCWPLEATALGSTDILACWVFYADGEILPPSVDWFSGQYLVK